tara:strand:+ start:188 stop:613 length:426 start_codon:yes stop_codon:yes gene_type:complete
MVTSRNVQRGVLENQTPEEAIMKTENNFNLSMIKEAQRQAREQTLDAGGRHYKFLKMSWEMGWQNEETDEREVEEWTGQRITMRDLLNHQRFCIENFGKNILVWVGGRYDLGTHIDGSHEDYEYQIGEYWDVNLYDGETAS